MNASENHKLRDIVVSQKVKKATTFPPYWATRPPVGIRIGINFMDPFKAEIRDIIEAGNEEKLEKLSA